MSKHVVVFASEEVQRRSRNNHEDAADRDGGCERWTGSTESEGLLNFAGEVV